MSKSIIYFLDTNSYTFNKCFKSYEERYNFEKYKCFPNPFIDKDFDLDINGKDFNKICNSSVKQILPR